MYGEIKDRFGRGAPWVFLYLCLRDSFWIVYLGWLLFWKVSGKEVPGLVYMITGAFGFMTTNWAVDKFFGVSDKMEDTRYSHRVENLLGILSVSVLGFLILFWLFKWFRH